MKQIILLLLLVIAVSCYQNGMDVSVWQGAIDWSAVKNTDIKFTIARASYGLSTDSYFAANWKGMINNGIKPGAYHYYVPSDDAAAQAKHFASVIKSVAGPYTSSYIPAVLDIEVNGGQTASQLSQNCIVFLQTLQNELGIQPMVYTYIWFANTYLQDAALATYPLWIANWDVSAPTIPGAWHNAGKTYLYWQYADNGSVEGISGKGAVDLDRSA